MRLLRPGVRGDASPGMPPCRSPRRPGSRRMRLHARAGRNESPDSVSPLAAQLAALLFLRHCPISKKS